MTISQDDCVVNGDSAEFKRIFTKTRMCKFFINGRCKHGATCGYAHSDYELRPSPDLRKTRICENFRMGKCTLGNNCIYAHGKEDLKNVIDEVALSNDQKRENTTSPTTVSARKRTGTYGESFIEKLTMSFINEYFSDEEGDSSPVMILSSPPASPKHTRLDGDPSTPLEMTETETCSKFLSFEAETDAGEDDTLSNGSFFNSPRKKKFSFSNLVHIEEFTPTQIIDNQPTVSEDIEDEDLRKLNEVIEGPQVDGSKRKITLLLADHLDMDEIDASIELLNNFKDVPYYPLDNGGIYHSGGRIEHRNSVESNGNFQNSNPSVFALTRDYFDDIVVPKNPASTSDAENHNSTEKEGELSDDEMEEMMNSLISSIGD